MLTGHKILTSDWIFAQQKKPSFYKIVLCSCNCLLEVILKPLRLPGPTRNCHGAKFVIRRNWNGKIHNKYQKENVIIILWSTPVWLLLTAPIVITFCVWARWRFILRDENHCKNQSRCPGLLLGKLFSLTTVHMWRAHKKDMYMFSMYSRFSGVAWEFQKGEVTLFLCLTKEQSWQQSIAKSSFQGTECQLQFDELQQAASQRREYHRQQQCKKLSSETFKKVTSWKAQQFHCFQFAILSKFHFFGKTFPVHCPGFFQVFTGGVHVFSASGFSHVSSGRSRTILLWCRSSQRNAIKLSSLFRTQPDSLTQKNHPPVNQMRIRGMRMILVRWSHDGTPLDKRPYSSFCELKSCVESPWTASPHCSWVSVLTYETAALISVRTHKSSLFNRLHCFCTVECQSGGSIQRMYGWQPGILFSALAGTAKTLLPIFCNKITCVIIHCFELASAWSYASRPCQHAIRVFCREDMLQLRICRMHHLGRVSFVDGGFPDFFQKNRQRSVTALGIGMVGHFLSLQCSSHLMKMFQTNPAKKPTASPYLWCGFQEREVPAEHWVLVQSLPTHKVLKNQRRPTQKQMLCRMSWCYVLHHRLCLENRTVQTSVCQYGRTNYAVQQELAPSSPRNFMFINVSGLVCLFITNEAAQTLSDIQNFLTRVFS